MIDEPFLYVDAAHRQVIVVYPAEAVDEWRELEHEVVDTRELGFVPESAIGGDDDIGLGEGDEVTLRTVFGLEALREKLMCADHAIDDAKLEAVKLRLILDGQIPGDIAAEPRLSAVEDENLVLVCEPISRPGGEPPHQSVIRLPRHFLERNFDDGLPGVDGGTWVDAGRVLYGRKIMRAPV
jgi:hypothetical protein